MTSKHPPDDRIFAAVRAQYYGGEEITVELIDHGHDDATSPNGVSIVVDNGYRRVAAFMSLTELRALVRSVSGDGHA